MSAPRSRQRTNNVNWRYGKSIFELGHSRSESMEHKDAANDVAFEKAAELLGKPLELPLERGEPRSGDDV
jgi:hypothetical protein